MRTFFFLFSVFSFFFSGWGFRAEFVEVNGKSKTELILEGERDLSGRVSALRCTFLYQVCIAFDLLRETGFAVTVTRQSSMNSVRYFTKPRFTRVFRVRITSTASLGTAYVSRERN